MYHRGEGEMTQWVKALAAKLDMLNHSPGTLKMEGESQLYKLSSDFRACTEKLTCNK